MRPCRPAAPKTRRPQSHRPSSAPRRSPLRFQRFRLRQPR
jgi:hypothetical protein